MAAGLAVREAQVEVRWEQKGAPWQDDDYGCGEDARATRVRERTDGRHMDRLVAPGMLVVSSDGSEFAGVGGFGYVAVAADGRAQTACGVVQPGPGTVSSYRAEAYGLLAPMRELHANHKGDKVYHYLDNKSVVDMYNNRQREPVAAADVWDEIRYWQGRWGQNYIVTWTKGHPEEYKLDRRTWTYQDWGNHVSDGLADLGRLEGTGDMRTSFTHGRRWRIYIDDDRCFDKIEPTVRMMLARRHIDAYAEKHGAQLRDANHAPVEAAERPGLERAVRLGAGDDVEAREHDAKEEGPTEHGMPILRQEERGRFTPHCGMH
jgi:hypothetical protein